MHVVLVNQWYPPETVGGVASHNYNFARECVKQGHQVTVIACRHRRDAPFKQFQNGVTILRAHALNLYRMRKLPAIGRQYRVVQALVYSAVVCRLLGTLHRQKPVDIAEFADVNAEAFFWNEQLSYQLAVRCHTPTFVLARYYTRTESPYAARMLSRVERHTIGKARILTAPSHDMARIISAECQIPLARIHTVPNAVERVNLVKVHATNPSTPISVLFVGRLERVKGVDVLLEAIPQVLERSPNIRFVIVGGSRKAPSGVPYQTYLHESLRTYIQRGQVELTGFVSDEHLETLYTQAHIGVVPSLLYESFSFTVAQAMMRELAVIASRVGGIPETLDNGRCGILVDPNDSHALSEAITQLSQDSTKRKQLGESARAHAEEYFSSDVVTKRILNLYGSTLL